MAKTKAKKEPAKKAAKPKRTVPKATKDFKGMEVAEVEVKLGSATLREKGVALSLEAKLEDLDVNEAYDVLVDSRLNVLLEIDAHQTELFGDDPLPRIESVADCKKLSVGISTISFRFVFDAKSVDVVELQKFVGKQATLWAAKVGHVGKPGKDEEPDEGVFEDTDPVEAAVGKDK